MPIWVNSLMKNILYMFNQIYLRTPAGWNFHAVNDSKTSRARFPGIQAKIQGVGQDFAGLRLKPFGLNFPTEDSHGFPTILRKLYNWNSSLWTIYIYLHLLYVFKLVEYQACQVQVLHPAVKVLANSIQARLPWVSDRQPHDFPKMQNDCNWKGGSSWLWDW